MGTGADQNADLYQQMMIRWNQWQTDILNQPAIQREFSLTQVLSFRMCHRLNSLESVGWFVKHIQEEGLLSLQEMRWHQASDGPIQLRVFTLSASEFGILNGHHRLVAACLAAHRVSDVSWDDCLSLFVHRPRQETLALWRLSIAEIDPLRRARYDQLTGAQERLGTLGDYLGDFSLFELDV